VIEHKFYLGDALEVLKNIPDRSIHCCITSPPYWGLRDYGINGQLGMEETLEGYVTSMVRVFREVMRVLRPDGTLWLNLGDSYTGNRTGDNLKPKNLVGIPWRVALALQEDGWYLRSDIIWHKPNCMPSSVTDRPTTSHEYVFLLSKSRQYFYDAEAIKEDSVDPEGSSQRYKYKFSGREGLIMPNGKPQQIAVKGKRGFNIKRNKRTVWTVPTQPFSGSHFAVFPPKLIEPMILAGTSPKACEICGAPWERVIEKKTRPHPNRWSGKNDARQFNTSENKYGMGGGLGVAHISMTVSWQPTCKCDNKGTGRCVVLDPFGGSGTVSMVAKKLGRASMYIDINPEYVKMAISRCNFQQGGLFETHTYRLEGLNDRATAF